MAGQAQRDATVASREQCNELLRILSSKRRQPDGVNAVEKVDYRRFEANDNARRKI